MFIVSSTILQASTGLNSSHKACDAGILLCLACYLSSKVLMYFFLVEKVTSYSGGFFCSEVLPVYTDFNRYQLSVVIIERAVGKTNYSCSIRLA